MKVFLIREMNTQDIALVIQDNWKPMELVNPAVLENNVCQEILKTKVLETRQFEVHYYQNVLICYPIKP